MRDLNAVVNGFANGKWAAQKLLAERAAVQQLRYEVRRALKGSEPVNGKNVGMVQRRGRLRFLLKTAQPVGISRKVRRQDLDRHFALQSRVAGAVHFAHSARTKGAEDFKTIQLRTWGQWHR